MKWNIQSVSYVVAYLLMAIVASLSAIKSVQQYGAWSACILLTIFIVHVFWQGYLQRKYNNEI